MFYKNIFKIFICIQTMRIFMLFISKFEPCVKSSVYTMCHQSCHSLNTNKDLKKKLNHFRPQIFGNSLSEKLYKNICKFWIVDSYCNMYLWEFSCYSYPDLNSVSNHQCTLCVIHLVIERLLQNLKLSKPWLRSP